jgi:hypothetical protein
MPAHEIRSKEPLYEYTVNLGKVTEYGVSFADLNARRVVPPTEGALFDIAFAGPLQGFGTTGAVSGVDRLYVRPDGRVEINVRATITLEDGKTIAHAATGVSNMDHTTGSFLLRENQTLFSSHAEYRWVNRLQVWAVGELDAAAGTVTLSCYSV